MTDDQPETGGATEQGRFGDEPWRPARETRAQRQWRPGTRRRRRSVRALFTSTILMLEAVLIFFLGLMLFGMHRDEPGAWWFVAGYSALAAVAVLTCALVRKPVGIAIGWAIQAVLLASGFWEYSMFVVGALFALTWAYAVIKGGAMDVENAQRDRLEAAWEAEHGR
ncbi:DUF4233 domain-containing protein [Micrococcus luteus]|uniref:DUF4233 domain-containing protein n=1 Tax=Micrococcus luteus TaxID=1270 RepID=UPI0020CBE09A|nr:DUF4233 domain-containing protein [Micrococcus luteus]UTT46537.1 DUF4233 domain-containing protein [Micrococcus luteus]